MAGVGVIPRKQTASIEIACELHEDVQIHPFAYRTHTHKMGKLVSGYKVVNGSEWTLIAERNPISTPQAFYDVQDYGLLKKSDILVIFEYFEE